MGRTVYTMSMSLDGYVAAPAADHGMGILHEWGISDHPADRKILDGYADAGAIVVGRRTFDHSGAWGGSPPLGLPCFVLTHHPPPEWTKPDSPFTFVTDGIESAVTRARDAARGRYVGISGADTARQALEAGLLDEIQIQLVPILFGAGVRLFGDLDAPVQLERRELVESPKVTHLRFGVVNRAPAR
jgi:dihydrofolate reductase